MDDTVHWSILTRLVDIVDFFVCSLYHYRLIFSYVNRDVGNGPKVGQIGTKWDKSGTFSDQKLHRFVPFGAISDIASF